MSPQAPRQVTRQVTLMDVARVAGVSRATASRVLGGGSASPSSHQRVTAAAHLLGYLPDPVARALARRSGLRLAVAVCSAAGRVTVDHYLGQVIGAAAEVC